jgi:alpha-beta hydrolase superfamily lysophospholipase
MLFKWTRPHRLLWFARRGIYRKDKYLDPEQYKPKEDEYKQVFYKNYADKESLTQQEMEEVEKLHQKEEEKVVDISRIRQMFDTITELQSDPEGKKAREFEKKMEEMEKANKNKRRTQVFIKTMRRGRIVSNEKVTTGGGSVFNREELQQNAYNYLLHKFPEENFITDFPLHHYRFPATSQPEGIAFFFHDQSRYMGKYAHIAEYLAGRGIEVVGFDLPGHGRSTGTRGYFGSYEEVGSHAKNFIQATIQQFGYHKIPRFGIGVSTGTLSVLSLALEDEKLFRGINLICPLIKNDGAHPTFYKYTDFLGKAFPKLGMMKIDSKSTQPFEDPLLFSGNLKAGLFKEIDDTSYYLRNNAHRLKVPVLIAHGGIDDITKPGTVRDFFDKIETEDKDIILYDD